jgi:hypothetical protein
VHRSKTHRHTGGADHPAGPRRRALAHHHAPVPRTVAWHIANRPSYFERHRAGEVLMGPAAARVSRELRQAVNNLGLLPGHIADPARVRAMLAHVANALFIGVMNDCFFDPATALCLSQGRNAGHGTVPP